MINLVDDDAKRQHIAKGFRALIDPKWTDPNGVKFESSAQQQCYDQIHREVLIYLTYSDQYPTRESGDKVACLDKVLLSFVVLQCGSML